MTFFLFIAIGLILWFVSNFFFKSKKTEVEEIVDKIDMLKDDDIHELLTSITKRFLMLNWYDKEHISSILDRAIDDEDWEVIIRRQEELADATNQLTREWASLVLDELYSPHEEIQNDSQKTLEEVLYTLSNNQLRMYAGVTSTNKNKAELVEIILQYFQNNIKKVVDKKLERIASLLS